ncbi:MAG: hypothetical protein WDW38_010345 [Sanguina aurantia]
MREAMKRARKEEEEEEAEEMGSLRSLTPPSPPPAAPHPPLRSRSHTTHATADASSSRPAPTHASPGASASAGGYMRKLQPSDRASGGRRQARRPVHTEEDDDDYDGDDDDAEQASGGGSSSSSSNSETASPEEFWQRAAEGDTRQQQGAPTPATYTPSVEQQQQPPRGGSRQRQQQQQQPYYQQQQQQQQQPDQQQRQQQQQPDQQLLLRAEGGQQPVPSREAPREERGWSEQPPLSSPRASVPRSKAGPLLSHLRSAAPPALRSDNAGTPQPQALRVAFRVTRRKSSSSSSSSSTAAPPATAPQGTDASPTAATARVTLPRTAASTASSSTSSSEPAPTPPVRSREPTDGAPAAAAAQQAPVEPVASRRPTPRARDRLDAPGDPSMDAFSGPQGPPSTPAEAPTQPLPSPSSSTTTGVTTGVTAGVTTGVTTPTQGEPPLTQPSPCLDHLPGSITLTRAPRPSDPHPTSPSSGSSEPPHTFQPPSSPGPVTSPGPDQRLAVGVRGPAKHSTLAVAEDAMDYGFDFGPLIPLADALHDPDSDAIGNSPSSFGVAGTRSGSGGSSSGGSSRGGRGSGSRAGGNGVERGKGVFPFPDFSLRSGGRRVHNGFNPPAAGTAAAAGDRMRARPSATAAAGSDNASSGKRGSDADGDRDSSDRRGSSMDWSAGASSSRHVGGVSGRDGSGYTDREASHENSRESKSSSSTGSRVSSSSSSSRSAPNNAEPSPTFRPSAYSHSPSRPPVTSPAPLTPSGRGRRAAAGSSSGQAPSPAELGAGPGLEFLDELGGDGSAGMGRATRGGEERGPEYSLGGNAQAERVQAAIWSPRQKQLLTPRSFPPLFIAAATLPDPVRPEVALHVRGFDPRHGNSATEVMLRRSFRNCGRVERVVVLGEVALLEMASVGGRVRACDLDGMLVGTMPLRVEALEPDAKDPSIPVDMETPPGGWKPMGDQGATLFVKGLDTSYSENVIRRALTETFSGCGKVLQVRLPVDHSKMLKGIAFIAFDSYHAKALASSMVGVEVLGRALHLDPNPGPNVKGVIPSARQQSSRRRSGADSQRGSDLGDSQDRYADDDDDDRYGAAEVRGRQNGASAASLIDGVGQSQLQQRQQQQQQAQVVPRKGGYLSPYDGDEDY